MPASDPGILVLTTPPSGCAEILEPAALQFLGALARRFEPERQRRLARRRERQQELDAGRLPDFLPETKEIRDRDWTVAPIRPDLTDRDRKSTRLNSSHSQISYAVFCLKKKKTQSAYA